MGSDPNDSGFVAAPGSHKRFNEIYEKEKMEDKNYFTHLPEDRWDEYIVNPKKIVTKPGDFIVWDSRVMHGNAPSKLTTDKIDHYNKNVELKRLIAYVCMCPASHATQAQLIEKVN